MSSARRRRVAVSGLGSIARQHVAALASLGGVDIAVFDPSPLLREEAQAGGAVARVHDSFEALLDDRPDALIVAGPDAVHLPQLRAAVERRIPTLVEKPLADSLPAARELVPAVEATGVPVLVGYVLRYRLAVGTVKRLVDDGAIGTPVSFQVMLGAYGTITAASSRFLTPEPNRLYRDYSHEWDYLRWIFGPLREVLAVSRTFTGVPHVEEPNLVDGLLALHRDIVGSFHIDYVEPRGTRTLHVVGSGGTLQADFREGTVALRMAGEEVERSIRQVESAADALARQARHLLAVAAGDEEPRVTLADGLAALETTDALVRSAGTRGWVEVAPTGGS